MGDIHDVIDLVLLGAGHAHVAVLRRLAARPVPGLHVTLISREPHSLYAGMLTGLIRGEHDFDAAHLDLRALSRAAGARLIIGAAEGLDLVDRIVRLDGRPAVPFDILSVNIGAVPAMPASGGTPAKPVGQLLARLAEIEPLLHPQARLAVVGAGAGGTELALALARRLSGQVRIALVCADAMPVIDAPARARSALRDALVDAGVELISGVRAGAFHDGELALSDGSTIDAVAALWATGARGAPFLAEAGLGCDEDGAIVVDGGLRSLTHPFVFAAGDCASRCPAPRVDIAQAKSAAKAMREGPLLEASLRRAARGQPPARARHGDIAASRAVVLALGNGQAIGWRGALSHVGPSALRWKRRVDQGWMARQQPRAVDVPPSPPWRGIRPAMAEASLARAMEGLPRLSPARLPTGASVIQTTSRHTLFLDDPFSFGQIAAAAALAELPNPGARPWMATGSVAWTERDGTGGGTTDLRAMLHGIASVLAMEGCALTGLRPEPGDRLAVTLGITFLMDPGQAMWSADIRHGDALVLTKPLGTGLILEADRRGLARARWLQAAIGAMRRPNGPAATILRGHGAICWAGVGTRGLGGAMATLLGSTGLATTLRAAPLPALPGARDIAAMGIADPIAADNHALLEESEPGMAALLADPQLSGGLLAAVPATHADSCLHSLRQAGHAAAIIGYAQAHGLDTAEAEPDIDAGWPEEDAADAELVVAGQG